MPTESSRKQRDPDSAVTQCGGGEEVAKPGEAEKGRHLSRNVTTEDSQRPVLHDALKTATDDVKFPAREAAAVNAAVLPDFKDQVRPSPEANAAVLLPTFKDQVRPSVSQQQQQQQQQREAASSIPSAIGVPVASEESVDAVTFDTPEDQERLNELEQRLEQAEERLEHVERQPVVSNSNEEAEAGSVSFHGILTRCDRKKGRLWILLGFVLIAAVVISISLVLTLSGDGHVENKIETGPTEPPASRKFCLNSSCWVQIGDIVGTQEGDRFGWPLSLVANGTRIAASAWLNDFSGEDAGLVRVFDIESSGTSTQVGSDIYGERADDIARGVLSRDGKRLAVGSPRHNGRDSTKEWIGQVRVFELQSGSWTQLGSAIYGEAEEEYFGRFPALSYKGSIMAVGAQWHHGPAGPYSGHVQVFQYTGSAWTRLGGDIDGVATDDEFGYSVAISDDGKIVAAGARYNDGNGPDSGHTGVFLYDSGNWMQMGTYINGSFAGDESGTSVFLSSDGKTLAIGAPYSDGNGPSSGQIRVFTYDEDDNDWHPTGAAIYGDESGDELAGVSLSGNGMRLAISSYYAHKDRGYARVYENIDGNWQPLGGKIMGQRPDESFGADDSLSSDGLRLAACASSWTVEPPRKGVVRLYELRDETIEMLR